MIDALTETPQAKTIEAAQQLCERLRSQHELRITLLTYGTNSAADLLHRNALALNADQQILVLNDGHPHPDPLTIARVFAAAIHKLGDADLVLVSNEEHDWGTGQIGGLLAEELNVPLISFVDYLEIITDGFLVRRQTEKGWEMFSAKPPLIVSLTKITSRDLNRLPTATLTNGTVEPSITTPRAMTTWTLDEIEVNAAEVRAGNSYYEVIDINLS